MLDLIERPMKTLPRMTPIAYVAGIDRRLTKFWHLPKKTPGTAGGFLNEIQLQIVSLTWYPRTPDIFVFGHPFFNGFFNSHPVDINIENHRCLLTVAQFHIFE